MHVPFASRKFLPSGIAATAILAIATLTNSTIAQDAAHTHGDLQGKADSASVGALTKADPAVAARLTSSYGKLPIGFEVNQGQADSAVQFLARGAGYTLLLTPGEAVLSLRGTHAKAVQPGRLRDARPSAQAEPSSTVQMEMIGSNRKAEVAGVDPLPGKANYFIGSDPAKWHTDVPTYAKVRYRNVYPGVDLVYYGNQEGRLEHDFVVAPGADPRAIAVGFRQVKHVSLDRSGGVTLRTRSGDVELQKPSAYQLVDGERKPIPSKYKLLAGNRVRFAIGAYDARSPLYIDPVLRYSAVFGSTTDSSWGNAIAADKQGNAYVTGTVGEGFPTAIVAKINPTGTALLYTTYLTATSRFTQGNGIAVDSTGRAYVVGLTEDGFPVVNAHQPLFGGQVDAYLAVLSATGNSLAFATYLGGSDEDTGNAIAVDSADNAYVTGYSGYSFPAQHSLTTHGNIFVAKFNRTGVLQYSTVLGQFPSQSAVSSIAVDRGGNTYLGGVGVSGFPVTAGALQTSCPTSKFCGIVVKLNAAGTAIGYSTYLGRALADFGAVPIAVDSDGEAYVAGTTIGGFPAFTNGFQRAPAGGYDAFVAKLNAAGSRYIWFTYLGGSGDDYVDGMVLDAYRNVYLTGFTTSTNFPLKAPVQGTSGQRFVTTLSGSLSSIPYYSTYFGGTAPFNEHGAIAVDPALNVYITGITYGEIPATPGAVNINPPTHALEGDVFISKLVIMDDIALGLSGSPSPVVHGGNLTYTIAVTSKGPDFGYNVRVADTLPAGTTFVSYGAGGGTCTAPAVGGMGTLNCTLPQLNAGATWNVTLTVNVNAASGTNVTNTAAAISNMQDFVPGNNSGGVTVHVN
jgi:uncharacterized repeat protein (TIGR01451 family)